MPNQEIFPLFDACKNCPVAKKYFHQFPPSKSLINIREAEGFTAMHFYIAIQTQEVACALRTNVLLNLFGRKPDVIMEITKEEVITAGQLYDNEGNYIGRVEEKFPGGLHTGDTRISTLNVTATCPVVNSQEVSVSLQPE